MSVGYKLFPKLSVAAIIVLAKAAHNGFQEHVFSIGTFMDKKQQKRRLEENYKMDVLQKINCKLLMEDDYFEELDKMAKKETAEEEDKRKVRSFFEVTEKVQDTQASKSPEECQEDDSLVSEDDEISVVLDKDGPEKLGKNIQAYYDMRMLMDTDLDDEDDDSLDIFEPKTIMEPTTEGLKESPNVITPKKISLSVDK